MQQMWLDNASKRFSPGPFVYLGLRTYVRLPHKWSIGASLNNSIPCFSLVERDSRNEKKRNKNNARHIWWASSKSHDGRLCIGGCQQLRPALPEWETLGFYCRLPATYCNGHQQQRAIKTDGVSLRFPVPASFSLPLTCPCLSVNDPGSRRPTKNSPPPTSTDTCRESFFFSSFYYDVRPKDGPRRIVCQDSRHQEIKLERIDKKETILHSFFFPSSTRCASLFCPRRFILLRLVVIPLNYIRWPARGMPFMGSR